MIEPSAIVQLLQSFRYACPDELDLQNAVEVVLRNEGVPFEREARLGPGERPDFLIDGGIALELKTQGSAAEVFRQLQRYAQHPSVRHLVLLTTRAQHVTVGMVRKIGGKPVDVVRVAGVL